MTILRTAAAAALLVAPLSLSPAFAQEMMGEDAMMGDEMMAHDIQVDCSVQDMGEMGMTIMFHNMSAEEIPAGTMGHWTIPGVAQGDVSFKDAVAPDGVKEQMYHSDTMVHGSASSPCSVELM